MSLSVSSLSVQKSGKTILSDITFTAPAGQVTGLIGPNGAGKSTLLAAVLGLEQATGTAAFDAQNLPAMPRRDRARMVAFVEQSASTEERLTVRDVVALGRRLALVHVVQGDEELVAAALFRLPLAQVIDHDAAHQGRGDGMEMGAVLPVHALLHVQAFVSLVGQFGGAQGQRVAVAAHLGARQLAQHRIDIGRQRVFNTAIAAFPAIEQFGDR